MQICEAINVPPLLAYAPHFTALPTPKKFFITTILAFASDTAEICLLPWPPNPPLPPISQDLILQPLWPLPPTPKDFILLPSQPNSPLPPKLNILYYHRSHQIRHYRQSHGSLSCHRPRLYLRGFVFLCLLPLLLAVLYLPIFVFCIGLLFLKI